MPSVSLPNISATRARSYVFRLPLFTRVVITAIIAIWVAQVTIPVAQWDIKAWGSLVPAEVGLSSSKYFGPMNFFFGRLAH